jgi:uncharacterized protein YcbK (DUF882 family)
MARDLVGFGLAMLLPTLRAFSFAAALAQAPAPADARLAEAVELTSPVLNDMTLLERLFGGERGGEVPRALDLLVSALVAAFNPPELMAMVAPVPPRSVPVYNVNSDETTVFRIRADGTAEEAEVERITEFFKCRRTHRRRPMDPGVLAILSDLSREYEGHTIEIVSGYRARPYGVRNSKHFIGHAIDLRVRGVKTTKVRDYLWRTQEGVGVGYYLHQDFIHVDYRPDDKDTAWTSRHEGAPYQYMPAWARKIRRELEQEAAHELEHQENAESYAAR